METSQAQAADLSAPAVATPATGAEAPQPDLSNLSLEQLDSLLTGGDVEVPVKGSGEGGPATEPTIEPVAPAVEPAVEPATEVEPVAPATEPTTPATEPVAPPTEPATAVLDDDAKEADRIKRPRLNNVVDQQIAAVFKAAEAAESPISWAEAERRVKGDPVAPEAVAPVVEAPPASEQVTSLSGEIQVIEERLMELGSSQGLYNEEIAKLQIDLSKKAVALSRAEDKAVQEANELVALRKESDASRANYRQKAIEKWPAIADKTSPLHLAIRARFAEMKNPKHPNHQALYTDSVPLDVARAVAEELGIAAKVAVTPSPAPSTQPVPRVTVQPAPSTATAVAPVKPAEDAKRTVEYLKKDATLEELDELFGAGDLEKGLLASIS